MARAADREFEHPIEEVHRLLDKLDSEVKEELAAIRTRDVDAAELPELSQVILELLGWTNTAYMENTMGIHPSVLSKFVKQRGRVNLSDARILADRVRSYVRGQDYAFDATQYELGIHRWRFAAEDEKAFQREEQRLSKLPAAPLSVRAEIWVAITPTATIKTKIADLASLLESIVQHVNLSNLPPDEQALTEIERAQLIAILETSLAILKSPMAEKRMLKAAGDFLKKGAEKAAEKQVQDGLGGLMNAAAHRIGELIGIIFS